MSDFLSVCHSVWVEYDFNGNYNGKENFTRGLSSYF